MQMRLTGQSPSIYKRDSKGKLRQWSYNLGTDGNNWAWSTTSGLVDGQLVTSDWRLVTEKNVGKTNQTSPEQQASLEADAELTKKLESGYFYDRAKVDQFDKFVPMLAHTYTEDSVNWDQESVFEQPKLDGIRCIARADGLWTRSGKPIRSVPHVWEQLAPVFAAKPTLVLDGELYNHELRDNFNELASIIRKETPIVAADELIQYHIYDCVYTGQNEAFFIRKEDLEQLFATYFDENRVVKRVTTCTIRSQADLDSRYAFWLAVGYEGQMIRKLNSLYENKRSRSLLKRKEFLTAEFQVVSVEEGLGNWSGCVKRFNLRLPDGRAFDAGVRGTQYQLAALWQAERVPTWATLRYFTPTPDGVPRFPVVVDWGIGERED
jgi:DNA ligase-1